MAMYAKKGTNDLINRAIKFATDAHGDQIRKVTEIPYIFHCFDVAEKVWMASGLKGKEREKATIVALLHDVREDTLRDVEVVDREILEAFGQEILDAVVALSNEENVKESGKNSRMNQLQTKLKKLRKEKKWIAVIKVADRLSNLKEFPDFWSSDKIFQYLNESGKISEMLGGFSEDLNALLIGRIYAIRKTLSIKKVQ